MYIVNNVSVLRSIVPACIVQQNARNFGRAAVLLLGKSEFVSSVYGRVISHRNAEVNRDVCIVVACIRYYVLQ